MSAGNPTPTTGAAEATADPARRSDLVLASSGPDSDAVERITARHAQLAGSAAALTAQLLEATADGDREPIRQANTALLDWAQDSLDSLLGAEQSVVDPAIRQADAGLSDRLSTGRGLVTSTVLRLAGLSGAAETAGTAAELRVHLGQYLRSFDDLALPLLARSSGLPLSSLWSEIESLTADDDTSVSGRAAARTGAAHCECGIVDEPAFVELDVRAVPHAIRHATVFGALDAIGPGGGLILVAPHDPLPLLAQIEQRTPGRFSVSYLDRGPEAWRLQLSAASPA